MLLKGTGATQESLLRPGSRRAIVSPYGKDTSRAAAFSALGDQQFRQRALTIAHEHTDVAEEAVAKTSVATDALFGINAPPRTDSDRSPRRQPPPPPPPRLARRAPSVQPIVTATLPPHHRTSTSDAAAAAAPAAATAPMSPVSPVSLAQAPESPPEQQQQQAEQQAAEQQAAEQMPSTGATNAAANAAATASAAPHGWVVASAGAAGAGSGDGIRMASQRNGCVYDEDGKLRFATLDALVERITTERYADASFNKDFVTTYNLFTDAATLLGLLTARYQQKGQADGTRLRVLIFLTTWVSVLWSSSTPPALVAALHAFLAAIDGDAQRGARDKLARTLQRALADDDSARGPFMFNSELPVPLLPLSLALGAPPPPVGVRSVHPKELARQLSLVEHELFRAVRPWELQNLAFSKKDKTLAPNIAAVTRHFNDASQWFACEILRERDLRARVRAAERVLDVAEHCRVLQNYNGVNEIISALNSSAVYRLKRTWDALSPRHTRLFRDLSELMANKRNYQNLRHQLHSVEPPLVPYLGVYLTDLTFIEEGNPTMRGNFVNWHKCRLQAKIIIEVQTYQQTPYPLQPVPWLRDFFLHVQPALDPDQQWACSTEIEPRAASSSSTAAASATTATTTTTNTTEGTDATATAATTTTTTAQPAPSASVGSSRPVGIPVNATAASAGGTTTATGTSPDEQGLLFGSPLSPLSASPSSAPSFLAGFSASQQQQQSQQPSQSQSQQQQQGTEETVGLDVYPPGSSLPVTVQLGADRLVSDVVQDVLAEAARQHLWLPADTDTDTDADAGQYTLVLAGTRAFPLGVQLQGALRLADAPDQVRKGGGGVLALYRALAVTDVLLPEGADAAYLLKTSLDAGAPLYTDLLVAASVLRRADDCALMMEDAGRQLWWLNANDALAAQGFDETRCRLVLFPLQRLLARSASDERERARSGRTVQALVSSATAASDGASAADTRFGYLSKLSAKALLRLGVFVRPAPALGSLGALGSSSSSSSSSGSSGGISSRSMLNLGTRSGGGGIGGGSSSSSSSSSSSGSGGGAAGDSSEGLGSLSSVGREASSSSSNAVAGGAAAAAALEKDKKRFLAIDNFLLCYSDAHAVTPRDVWALDQCAVSLGTLVSGALCIVVRPHRQACGAKKGKKRVALIAGVSEADTLEWCALLQRKSRYNGAQRVFARGLAELLLRERAPAPASFVPAFVRAALEALCEHALGDANLFTAAVDAAAVARVRERIDHGAVAPVLAAPGDAPALAQAVLSFYAEMPESLIPSTLFPQLWAYFRAAPEVAAAGSSGGSAVSSAASGGGANADGAAGVDADTEMLRALVAALPLPNRVNLKYLLTFCAMWGAEAGCAERVPAVLAPYLVRAGRRAAAPHAFAPIPVADVAARALAGLLRALPRLDCGTDAALPAWLAEARASAPPPRVPRTPVTLLDRDDAAALRAALDASTFVDDLAEPSSVPAPSASASSGAATGAGAGGSGAGGNASAGAPTPHRTLFSASCATLPAGSDEGGREAAGVRARTGSSGADADAADALDGDDADGASDDEGGGGGGARRPQSTRDKASSILKRLRESLAPRRRGPHAAHASLPAVATAGGAGSGSSSSGSACSTPTAAPAPPGPAESPTFLLPKDLPGADDDADALY